MWSQKLKSFDILQQPYEDDSKNSNKKNGDYKADILQNDLPYLDLSFSIPKTAALVNGKYVTYTRVTRDLAVTFFTCADSLIRR